MRRWLCAGLLTAALLFPGLAVSTPAQDVSLLNAAAMGSVPGTEQALRDGAQLEATDARGYTALMKAAARGHAEVVRLLLAKKADVQHRAADGKTTALGLAVEDFPITQLLVAAKADPDSPSERGFTALMRAADAGKRDRVEWLLEKGARIDAKNADGNSALYLAATSSQLDLVRLLLLKGASPDAPNLRGETPITATFLWGVYGVDHLPEVAARSRLVLEALLAQSHGPPAQATVAPPAVAEEPTTVELYFLLYARLGRTAELEPMVKRGARPDARDRHGYTALLHACAGGQLATARWLLSHGADGNAVNQKQETPLMLAAGAGSAPLVELLLSRGARTGAKSQAGRTALFWAARGSDEAAVVTALLGAGADVNVADNEGRTALLAAIDGRHQTVADTLIEAGADLKLRAADGRDPLILAIVRKLPLLARKLIDKGAPLDGWSSFSESALITAVGEADPDLLRRLLDKGAAIDAADPTHRLTPLMHAAMGGDLAVVQLLLDRGADPRLRSLPYNETAASLADQRSHPEVARLLREREQRLPKK